MTTVADPHFSHPKSHNSSHSASEHQHQNPPAGLQKLPQQLLVESLAATCCETGTTVLESARRRLKRVSLKHSAAEAAEVEAETAEAANAEAAATEAMDARRNSCTDKSEDFEAVIQRARMCLRPADCRRLLPVRPGVAPVDPEDEAALCGLPDFTDVLQRRLRSLRPAVEAPPWVLAAAAAATAAAATTPDAAPSAAEDNTDSQAASDILDEEPVCSSGQPAACGKDYVGVEQLFQPQTSSAATSARTSPTAVTTENLHITDAEIAGNLGAKRSKHDATEDSGRAAVSASLAALGGEAPSSGQKCRADDSCWLSCLDDRVYRRKPGELLLSDLVGGALDLAREGGGCSKVSTAMRRLLARDPGMPQPHALGGERCSDPSSTQPSALPSLLSLPSEFPGDNSQAPPEASAACPPELLQLQQTSTAADAATAADAVTAAASLQPCQVNNRRFRRRLRRRRLLESSLEVADRSSDSDTLNCLDTDSPAEES